MDQANTLREIIKNKPHAESPHVSARVITVTSGKGGVGKTNFAVNLAVYFSGLGKRVVIIDADFGLANIEVLFGIVPKFSIADILFGSKTIDEVLTAGPNGIKFISGGSGLGELANISDKQMTYLLDNFAYLDKISDIILIDTGAGISKSVVNFIKAGGETIIVTTPEPTSVTDAYALVKTITDEKSAIGGIPEIKIAVNRTETPAEGVEVYQKLSMVADRFLSVHLSYLGSIPYDNQLIKAVKKQQPAALAFPNSGFVQSLQEIGEKLLDISREKSHNQQGIKSFMKKLINIFGK